MLHCIENGYANEQKAPKRLNVGHGTIKSKIS